MSSSKEHQVPKRKRVYQACDPCRKRKYKCDGVRPSCGTCERSSLSCSWSARSSGHQQTATDNVAETKEKGPRARYVDLLQTRLRDLETLAREHGLDPGALLLAHQQETARRALAQSATENTAVTPELMDLSSGSSSVSLDSSAMSNLAEGNGQLSDQALSDLLAEEEDYSNEPNIAQTALDELVELFIACHYHVQPHNFLHHCTFMRELRSHSPLLMNAVYTLGAKYSNLFPGRPQYRAGDLFYERAEQLLHQSQAAADIEVIHALLLLSAHALSSGRTLTGVQHLDSAISIALSLDLHLEPEIDPSQTWVVTETRRRTFWACFHGDRQMANLGFRPRRISLEIVRVQLPSAELLWQTVLKSGESPQPDAIRDIMTDPYIAFLKLHDIFDRILPDPIPSGHQDNIRLPTWLYLPNPNSMEVGSYADRQSQLQGLDQELRAWFAGLPSWATHLGKYFIPDLTADKPLQSWFWVSVHLLYHTSRLLLRWPAMIDTVHSSTSLEYAKASAAVVGCREEAREIVRILAEVILPTNPTIKNLEPWTFGICIWQAATGYINLHRLGLLTEADDVLGSLGTCMEGFVGLGTHFEEGAKWTRDLLEATR
ncbi:uncharacterized protein SPPG_03516 [Spizellomyces punctatus DAOM BR117]|uniref:Zn(2)-C6 fungal-type domain-containing protein n=1 Tax=Spizellomyces punctatus (strain DAOM BR117) TaxID=645134 RepID=A0A0L0HL00_SPIPD|nr:uncharacterized protein SPPG_03516 [Spizellomyces punctatus DAOM BR117]KND01723.1 hypothetical protein SPPG_03516 [Spizellomyces punctatus DAOM BR117]|eukprot:XP_016609762.1 hypothetical protein SPPG_03516 [Spizellomyces punctatus DAOM BR117]